MSYQVLARKYRPRSFTQLVGQESTCRILKNALENQRIHHAYLFTGTRGVGKTSLARLLAKCLNCETKITAEPCEHCSACQAINANRFTDLLEVDAASRTKVEDTRDLLADIHYAPSQGRYKIYLIDEVHMLSSHSFNALLKTLEEPPPHVVFLLATTDPQRLPATILSRCLQFHLKALPAEQISQHLETILKNEQVPYELNALHLLAKASKGSLRDSLSLLDQAISYATQAITEQDVKNLLGSIAATDITELLEALILPDAAKIWAIVEKLNAQAADFSQVIDELLSHLHQIALTQVLTNTITKENESIQRLAQQISAEDTQLYYQIALVSRRDLSLAPTPRLGFEMMLLRMLAFRPIEQSTAENQPEPPKKRVSLDTTPRPEPSGFDKATNRSTLDWIALVKQLNLTGLSYTFACQCVLQEHTDNHIKLLLDPKQTALHTAKQEERLVQALSKHFGKPLSLSISLGATELLTPARYERQKKTQRLEETTKRLQEDSTLQSIIKTFDAKLQPESLQIVDEN